METISVVGSPSPAEETFWRGDAGGLQNAAKDAAALKLAYEIQKYTAFSFSEDGGKIVCTATVRLEKLPVY